MSRITRGLNVRDVAGDMKFEDDLKKKASLPKTPTLEKPYSRDLNEMGKKSYFEEYYNGIKLANQILPKVGPFEDPRETTCFKRGYIRGSEMVAIAERQNNFNLIPAEYQNIAQNRFTK